MIDVPPASSSTKSMLDVDKKRGLIASKPPKLLQLLAVLSLMKHMVNKVRCGTCQDN